MIRILIFFLTLVLVAGAITYFSGLEGRIQAEAFGLKFDGPSGLIAGGFFALVIGLIYLTSIFKDIMRLPSTIRAREEKTRREKGVTALARGLEAVAVGDAADASHHARIARRHLSETSLTRLLTAQAAQMNGDDVVARESFSAMLEAPETEFLGLRGLYAQALARDDKKAAQAHAERAFALRANAKWAFDSVFDLALDRGAWGDAREALKKARKNNLAPADQLDRADAALLTAGADAAKRAGDDMTALSEVEAALKLAPGFTPAAVMAARQHHEAGRKGKAIKIVEVALSETPHPALVKLCDVFCEAEKEEKRSDLLSRFANAAGDGPEGILLRVRRDLVSDDADAAITKLEPLLSDAPTTEIFALMGEAAGRKHGEEVSRGWIERAAAAPRDPRPGADGEFHFTNEGWATLVREYMAHGRLAPPPLEAAHYRLTIDEVKRLSAPPPVTVTAEANETDADEKEADAEEAMTIVSSDATEGDGPAPHAATPSRPAEEEEKKSEAPETETADEEASDASEEEKAARALAAARGVS